MPRLRKLAEVALFAIGVGGFACLLLVQLSYWILMPREPNPATGRIYPYNAMRFEVYVTEAEQTRGRWAELLGPTGLLVSVLGVGVLRQLAERQRQK